MRLRVVLTMAACLSGHGLAHAADPAKVCGMAIGVAASAKDAEDDCHESLQSEELAAAVMSCKQSLGWGMHTFMKHANDGEGAWREMKRKFGLRMACRRMEGTADRTYDFLFSPTHTYNPS